MKYVSVDIETTDVNPETGCVLSFGAVIEDTETLLPLEKLPRFEVYLENPEPIQGSYFALQMNHKILRAIATKETEVPIIPHSRLEEDFFFFLKENGFEPNEKGRITITVAGKNFAGFDEQFLKKLIIGSHIRFRKRVLDPVGLFTDYLNDEIPPDLKTCKERAGINTEVSHDAIEDALDVIALLRSKY